MCGPAKGEDLPGSNREEVLNVVLAQLLARRGLVSAPEQVVRRGTRTRLPDVMLSFRGLRTIIEGKYADVQGASSVCLDQARERVESGLAHIGIAVLYPTNLRTTPFHSLHSMMERGTFRIAVVSEAAEHDWVDASLDAFAEHLRHTHELLVSEDVVTAAVDTIEAAIDSLSEALSPFPAVVERSADALGIRDADAESS